MTTLTPLLGKSTASCTVWPSSAAATPSTTTRTSSTTTASRIPELGTTYEQLLEGATKMTKQTGDETTQWGYNFGYSSLEVNLGSFVLDHGGQVLNEARDKALYGEDQNAIAGAQLYVDMILKHRVVPWGEERQALREEGGSGRHIGTGKVAMSQITLIPLKGAYDVLGESLGIAPLGTGPGGNPQPGHRQ